MRRAWPLFSLFAAALAGCARSGRPVEPVAVHLGEDACAACRMIISDERYGAQIHRAGFEPELFDDLGCMLGRLESAGFDPTRVFVRSYAGGQWLRGDRAFVVESTSIRSPMGFGLAAFPGEEAARAEAARHGSAKVSDLATLARTRPRS